tara:strand:- start:71685 stop:73544 length:1860 start_codon:yes stop_codon:yes gene_type:complete
LTKVAIAFSLHDFYMFNRNHIKPDEKNYYLDFSDNLFLSTEQLEKSGFLKISEETIDKNGFKWNYINLLGNLGKRINSKEWWATSIASKNRISSILPILLFQYIRSIKIIKEANYDTLLILSPNLILFKALRDFINSEKQNFLSTRNFPDNIFFSFIINLLRKVREIKKVIINEFYFFKDIIGQATVILNNIKTIKKAYDHSYFNGLNKDFDYTVIKTHVYSNSFIQSSKGNDLKDPFFGDLPSFLSKREKIISLLHLHGDYNKIIGSINRCNDQILIPWEYLLNRREVIFSIFKLFFWRIKIKPTFLYDVNISPVVSAELKRSRFTLNSYLFYESMKRLLNKINIKKFFYTFENIPWERMAILSLREFSSTTKIIGYQHSIVPDADTGVLLSKDEVSIGPIPDRIFTTGEITSNIINRQSGFKNGIVSPACALRYEYLYKMKPKERTNSGNILLALEGSPSVVRMVNYVLDQLANLDDINLRIRAHPVMPYKTIKNYINFDVLDFENVTISKNSLVIDDLLETDILIYWGSTVALEALSMGIPLIRYKMGNLFSYDPLFELSNLKWECSEQVPLIDIINSIYKMNNSEYMLELRKAKSYLDRYFYPITKQNLGKFFTV